MHLPPPLQRALEELIGHSDHAELAAAAERVSKDYRSAERSERTTFLRDHHERLAYAATRLPATYAASYAALSHLRMLWPQCTLFSLLDVGSGSGAASWAACTLFESLHSATLFERDPHLVALGQQLARSTEIPAMDAAQWETCSLEQATLPQADLVIASYVLNELTERESANAARAMWLAAGSALALVEPGTTVCFHRLKLIRSTLIAEGAHLLAPCPHTSSCPLPENDWCHFTQRVPRTTKHRLFKRGDLGYEDEKFSYLIFTKQPVQRAQGRILRHPQRRKGHVHLRICEEGGIRDSVVSRKGRSAWKNVRKARWGDAWDEQG
ncbi:MAG: small ribosomal subunit Rsm22 family protein [Candidatus Latescibacterota bacterium]|nr:small ribosomal subunit Rsm22 family protein [Candidatus Latescibacterota bacterium]